MALNILRYKLYKLKNLKGLKVLNLYLNTDLHYNFDYCFCITQNCNNTNVIHIVHLLFRVSCIFKKK